MGFTQKLEFPEERISLEGEVHTFIYDFIAYSETETDFFGLYFLSVDEDALSYGRPRVSWLIEHAGEFATSPPADQPLLVIETDTDGTVIPASFWVDKYLALRFASGMLCLVRTFRGPWLVSQKSRGLATSPVSGRPDDTGHAANYELQILENNRAGASSALAGPVSMAEVSATEWNARQVPDIFGPRVLPAFTARGEFQDSFASQDIQLVPNPEDPESMTETVRFQLRYDRRIPERSRFFYDSKEYEISRFELTDRKRLIGLEGQRQIQKVTT